MKNVFGKTLGILALTMSLGACDQAMVDAQNASSSKAASDSAGPWEAYEINTSPVTACIPEEYRSQFTCAQSAFQVNMFHCKPHNPQADLTAIAKASESYAHRNYGVLPESDPATTNTKSPRVSIYTGMTPSTLQTKSEPAIIVGILDPAVTFNPNCQ